jgi:DNA invertase Pin-like site-specific DNA recombinase
VSDLLGRLKQRAPLIYFYGRHSAACSEDEQRAIFSGLGWGLPHKVVFDDVDGSIPFRDRPNGRKVWDKLEPGDFIVVTSMERGWANISDLSVMVRVLDRVGVRIRVLDFPFDLASDEGIAALAAFNSINAYSRRLRGQRVRDAFGERRSQGRPWSDTRPFGWRRDGDDWVELPEERDIADRMAELYLEGLGYVRIAAKLAAADVSKPVYRKRKNNGKTPRKSYYTATQVRRLLAARAAGYPVVPQVELLSNVPSGKYV